MGYINLKNINAIEERLHKQIAVLRFLCGDIGKAEEKIKHMSYMTKTKQALMRSKEALDANIRTLTSMTMVLEKVRLEYQQTEARITDRYNLDIVIYPETRFEISKITGMEAYQSLIPF